MGLGSDLGAWLQNAPLAVLISLLPCVPSLPPPQVGPISANGEREIGELIARAMEKVRGSWGGSCTEPGRPGWARSCAA